MYGRFKSFSSNVDIFEWSAIWLPSYHELHIWLGYGCPERFMAVNPGSNGFDMHHQLITIEVRKKETKMSKAFDCHIL